MTLLAEFDKTARIMAQCECSVNQNKRHFTLDNTRYVSHELPVKLLDKRDWRVRRCIHRRIVRAFITYYRMGRNKRDEQAEVTEAC